MDTRVLACGASALLMVPAAASAQLLQFDVNSISYSILDGMGDPTAFGGETHTGSVQLTLGDGRLPAVHVQESPGGQFEFQTGFTGTLTGFDVLLDLAGGQVTGGSIRLEVDGSDVYEATVGDLGRVQALTSGGFTIDYSSSDGAFSGPDFGGVDVSRWFAATGELPGWGLLFRFNPVGTSGTADTDIFVAVPAPASLALLAAAGIVATRRRR